MGKAKRTLKPKLSVGLRRLVNRYGDAATEYGAEGVFDIDSDKMEQAADDYLAARTKLVEHLITLEQEVLLLRAAAKTLRPNETGENHPTARDTPPRVG